MSKVIKFDDMYCKVCGKPLPLKQCVEGEDFCSRECAEKSLLEDYKPRVSKK